MSGESRALMVEGSADDAALMRRALRSTGLLDRVTTIRDARAALTHLQRSAAGSKARVIVLDLKLPGMDGLELLRLIRSRPDTQHTPVVILTSSDEPRELLQCYAHGANSFVRKPVDYALFREVIERLFRYWLVDNEPATRGSHVTER